MKKILLFTALLMLLHTGIYSGDRMVLVERFTSSTCPPCASNNPIMDAFLSSQDPDRIMGLSYHMNWPAPGNDPMFLHNPGDNTSRRTLYGVNSIPHAFMDGIISIAPPYSQGNLSSYFDSRKDILSPVTIIVRDTVINDSVNVFIKLYCEAPLANPNVNLFLVVYEKHIHYSSPPGTNGETDFYDVMRKMLPSANGQGITLIPGSVLNFTYKYKMHPDWVASQIKNVVMVQGSDKEILNVAVKTQNFTLTASPIFRSVAAGQNSSGTYYIKTPSVAANYNSPITFTAQVDPPTAGITVTFPNGTTLSNFNDSLMVNVSSTAAVAANDYRIILTGTNTNNKVHKTSVRYLVGKNYVITSANKSNLVYKIDGNTISGTKLFVWDVGTNHTLAAVQPQTFGSTRYVFQSWSNGGDSVQIITVPASLISYTVNYKIQFRLVTSVTPSGIPVNITNGMQYFDSAATVNLSVSPLEVQFNGKTWWFQRWVGTGNGSYTGTNPSPQLTMHNVIIENAIYDTMPIGIKPIGSELPEMFALHQNYPNPFNPVTTIKFDLPVTDNVNIKVYDMLGNELEELVSEQLLPGYYEVQFDATKYASGVYFYSIRTTSFQNIKKMVIVK